MSGHHRLLIVAPHCDDETLACGGLTLAAKHAGLDVHVMIVTNGDGFYFATMEQFHNIFPKRSDYVKMGELRQKESLSALSLLGVPNEEVTFLGYPDRGTPILLNDHWSDKDPFTSPYDHADRSPYPATYDHNAVYAGEDLLADMKSVLASYKPDLVVYPHPADAHPDHWGAGVFTRLAIEVLEHEDPTFKPDTYVYLVHKKNFPKPAGLQPKNGILPPKGFERITSHWLKLDLTDQDVISKWQAVSEYRSQLPLLRNLMESFIRRNELFGEITTPDLPYLAQGLHSDPSTWRTDEGKPVEPVQYGQTDGFVASRSATKSANIVSLYASRDGSNMLNLAADLRGRPNNGLTYTIRVLAILPKGEKQYVVRVGRKVKDSHQASANANYICDRVSMSELGNPWLVMVRAESAAPGGMILGSTPWQILRVVPSKAGLYRRNLALGVPSQSSRL
jgi:LmbE family N-acetylglucosaminyl deacetylase